MNIKRIIFRWEALYYEKKTINRLLDPFVQRLRQNFFNVLIKVRDLYGLINVNKDMF